MHRHQYDGTAVPGQAAPEAANLTPGNDKAHVASAGQVGEHEITEHRDPKPACGAMQACTDAESYATLQARLALAGWCLQRELHEADAKCAYRVWRWGRAAELPDLAAVAAFAVRVGAPA